jgi:hypothetical protein
MIDEYDWIVGLKKALEKERNIRKTKPSGLALTLIINSYIDPASPILFIGLLKQNANLKYFSS